MKLLNLLYYLLRIFKEKKLSFVSYTDSVFHCTNSVTLNIFSRALHKHVLYLLF